MNILVSACLLGCACRYDGKSKPCGEVISLKEKHNLIPVCPEIMGGLATPRMPSEIRDGIVINSEGKDNTARFEKGAREALRLCGIFGCTAVVLKSKSPSCGFGEIYDGTFTGKTVCGNGVTARLLYENGVEIYNEFNFGGAFK